MALGRHRGADLGVGVGERLLGGVGEHDPEAEGVLHPVPLVDGHLVAPVVPFKQDGEIEAGWPRPHDRDVHLTAGSHAGATIRRWPSTWSHSLQVTGLCT